MQSGSVFILFALAASAFGGSIVLNGDFGTGNLTDWTVNLSADNLWNVIPASDVTIGGVPTPFFATEGCQGASCINGTASEQNFLTQDIDTNTGDTYTLSFAYSPDAFDVAPDGPAELVVMWGNTVAIDLVFSGITPGGTQRVPLAGFQVYSIPGLTASASTTQLTFLGRQDPSGDGLTNIIVAAVSQTETAALPEPASYLLAAAGLFALGAAKFRASRA